MNEDEMFQEQFDLTSFGRRVNGIVNEARRARPRTIQGASAITRKKECDISGLAYMQFMRTAGAYIGLPGKEYIRRYRYTDALCGGGLNVVEGDIIEGSPYAISASPSARSPSERTETEGDLPGDRSADAFGSP